MRSNNWDLDPAKFLDSRQAERLLAAAAKRVRLANGSRKITAARDRFVVHLALATGLRVMEIAALKCGDVSLDDAIPSLVVRCGKGKKKRKVFFNEKCKKLIAQYLSWKRQTAEPTELDSPLLLSSRTGSHMTTRALQKAFKRCAKEAGLSSRYSIHSARHSYACLLLKASNWNLRLVQKQLGHSKITTTQVYADVMMPEIRKALNRLCF